MPGQNTTILATYVWDLIHYQDVLFFIHTEIRVIFFSHCFSFFKNHLKTNFCKIFLSCRENLDPQSLYTDVELWKSLELAQLKDVVISLPGCLGMLLSRVEVFSKCILCKFVFDYGLDVHSFYIQIILLVSFVLSILC